MSKRPILSIPRAVEIFEETVSCRRIYCADSSFFKMTDFWEDLCDEAGMWQVKTYRTDKTEDFKRKAGVIAFAGRATMTVDEQLWQKGRQGDMFFNFMLAHEAGHLVLDHHAKGKVTKHFQLYSGPNGVSNLPPTIEELETNYAAVFLQCGMALFDARWDTLGLARRAFSDPYYVGKAQKVVRLNSFQRLLNRPKPIRDRVVL